MTKRLLWAPTKASLSLGTVVGLESRPDPQKSESHFKHTPFTYKVFEGVGHIYFSDGRHIIIEPFSSSIKPPADGDGYWWVFAYLATEAAHNMKAYAPLYWARLSMGKDVRIIASGKIEIYKLLRQKLGIKHLPSFSKLIISQEGRLWGITDDGESHQLMKRYTHNHEYLLK